MLSVLYNSNCLPPNALLASYCAHLLGLWFAPEGGHDTGWTVCAACCWAVCLCCCWVFDGATELYNSNCMPHVAGLRVMLPGQLFR